MLLLGDGECVVVPVSLSSGLAIRAEMYAESGKCGEIGVGARAQGSG